MGRISERTCDSTQSNCGCGQAGVKGRDERKERALDTGLPTPTPLFAFFTAKGHKKCLDNADAVIHGATFPKGTFSYGQRTRAGRRSVQPGEPAGAEPDDRDWQRRGIPELD